ncbi:MAG: methyltransferase [Actinomycetota bacterium]
MVPPGPPSHYFDAEPTSGRAETSVELVLPDVRFTLATDRGVFARDHVDAGTKLLLLDGPDAVTTDRVLVDVGAGYGPIACTLAHRNPQATVWAVEVNSRARELCAANAAAASLTNLQVVSPEEVPNDLVADRIWSNPPIRIGKAALHELLLGWLGRLDSSGSAHLVVQRHLGADSLHRWMEGQGWSVTRRGSRQAYRLLDVAAPEGDGS